MEHPAAKIFKFFLLHQKLRLEIRAHLVVENPEKHTFGQNCPKSDATVKIFFLGKCEKKSSIVKYDEMLKHPKKCWFDLNVFDAPKKVARRSIEIDSPNGNLLRLVNFKFLPNPM